MIREFGESVGDAVATRAGRAAARVQERRSLPVDLLESDEGYLAVFDAPGATTSDVQVRYADGRVLVRVDRFREFHDGFSMRFPGRGLSLDGEVELPENAVVTAEHAKATLTDRGTLEVELPKVETAEVEASAEDADDGAAGTDAEREAVGGDEAEGDEVERADETSDDSA
ncbi:hypothetical protein GCM10028857_22140 [Salinarchaeum chitinilyticum]